MRSRRLTLLRSTHPDLVLVDIQLPGMNGLELTRRIKQDMRTRDIVVVAHTASAMKGDDQKAFEAGCDGYITKPIETLTLSKKVREYLERRTASSPAPTPTPGAPGTFPGGIVLSGPELESVRRRFLEDGMLQSRQLLDALDQKLDLATALHLTQNWVVGAQVLDYPAVAELASDVEKMLRSRNPDPADLFDGLSNIMVAFAEPPEAAIGPIPDDIVKLLKGHGIALVGCGREEAERLCAALDRAGAKPRLFDAGRTPDTDAIASCSAIVVHVRPETFGTHYLHPLTVAGLRQPLMLIGTRDHILELEASVVPRATELLIDGWQPEEALIRLAHALARAAVVKPLRSTAGGLGRASRYPAGFDDGARDQPRFRSLDRRRRYDGPDGGTERHTGRRHQVPDGM